MMYTSEIRQRLREHGIEHVSTAFLMGCEYGPDVPMYRVSWTQEFQDALVDQLAPGDTVEDYLDRLLPELRLRGVMRHGRYPGMCNFVLIQPTWEHVA